LVKSLRIFYTLYLLIKRFSWFDFISGCWCMLVQVLIIIIIIILNMIIIII